MKINAKLLLGLCIGFFILYFVFESFYRHENFYSLRLDLGNMDQTVWNVVHGHGFTLTDPMGDKQESRLAVHADFLLILLAPFYVIWSNPEMLLLIQAVVLGAGAIPIFWYAKEKLKSEKLALLFVIAFLLYPPLQRMALDDFHAVALSLTFLLFSYWYMYKENYWLFAIFAILAGLGKEQVWMVVGLMGLYIVVIKKKRLLGSVVAVIGFLAFYLLMWKFIPAVAPAKQHFALTYLSEFGSGQNEIIKNILKNPITVMHDIVAPDRFYYYFQLLLPVAFLSLFSPALLIFALPDLLINVLSNNMLMRWIDFQYTSTITPFIFLSAIEGFTVVCSLLQRLHFKKNSKFIIPLTAGVVILLMGYASFAWGELPLENTSRFIAFIRPEPEQEALKQIVKKVDPTATVSASNNIGAHFSERQYLYNFPINAESADIVLVKLGDPNAWPSESDQVAAVQKLLHNSSYELISQFGNFYAFKRV